MARAQGSSGAEATGENQAGSLTQGHNKPQDILKHTYNASYGTMHENEPLLADAEPGVPAESLSDDEIENPDRPKGFKFAVLFVCILLGDFFTGYDISCVATLAPVITDEFDTLNEVSWYGTSYLLASCATLLIFGQLYSFYSMKMVFELSFVIFIIGSLICAVAPSSAIFILGRALSGLGSAGVFAGGSIIVANTTSLKYRPIFQALSGGMESVAVALGPLISGAITNASNWRVSFYIIVPASVACCLAVYFFVHNLERPENAHLDGKEKLRRLDLAGFSVYVPTMVCLILGLQWAGSEYPWDNWRIILLLTLTVALSAAFLMLEQRAGADSMFPLAMFRKPTFAASCLFTFCNSAGLIIIDYNLPIYFQAIRHKTPLGSGIWFLPMAVSFAVAVVLAGPATSYLGYYNPIMIFGALLMILGTGLITTITPDTPVAQLIVYQILYGTGSGLAFQQPYTAVQVVLPEAQVPTALVTLSFTQEIGGIVALSVSQNVFINRLLHNLAKQVPSLDLSNILRNGILGSIESAPSELYHDVVQAYNDSLVEVFYFAVALTCLAMICTFRIKWRSVKE